MNRRLPILLLFAMFCWSRPLSLLHAEVIDKIAAVVDGRIITLSDIRLEHEVEAVLGDPSETDEELLKSMIDRALMEEEMAQFPSLDVADEEVDERMKAITDFRGVDPSAIRNAMVLKSNGAAIWSFAINNSLWSAAKKLKRNTKRLSSPKR